MEGGSVSTLRVIGFTSAACFLAFLGYKYLTADSSGYCRAQQRYISDKTFLDVALEMRMNELKANGGLDAYEKQLTSQKNNPVSAGRDFDVKNPNCCRVYRKKVEHYCGWDYPVCVRLNYQMSKADVDSGDIGRLYFFDNCGNMQDPL